MKSITSITLTLLIAFLVASCNRSAVVQEPTPQTKERVIYLGCEFPGDGENTTRMEISHPDLNTPLRMLWQSGDQLQIGFEQNGESYLATAAIVQAENIQENKSIVRGVPVTVPEGIDTRQPYTIYLAYGPDGTLKINSSKEFYLKLPGFDDIFKAGKDDYTTATYYANKKLPILYAKKEMSGGEESFSGKLQHLGSFFVLHLANTGSQPFTSAYWCKLENVGGSQSENEGMYVWNNGLPDKARDHFGSKFNLKKEQAVPTLDKGKKAYAGIVWDDRSYKRVVVGHRGAEDIAYVWYPVTPNVPMPALRFMISYQAAFWGSWCYKSETALPAGRTLERGKVYHFYVSLSQDNYLPRFHKRNWELRTDVVPIS